MYSAKYAKKTCRALSLLLALVILSSSCITLSASAFGETLLDISHLSDRFLADTAIADGGYISLGAGNEINFEIMGSGAKLRLKCIGSFPEEKQNAICIQLKNQTGSTDFSIELSFMNMSGDTSSVQYREKVDNSGKDSYIFLSCSEDLFLTGISLKAIGIGSGSVGIIGIWHCYYSFPEDASDYGAGSISALEYKENGAQVLIEGLVHHDITIAEKDSTVNVYRLLPGESISEEFIAEHKPCASSLVSRRFTFTVKNSTGDDYASAYAVVIQSADGKLAHIIEAKKYPDTRFEPYEHNASFKGIASSLEFLPARTYTDTVIIDLPTDLLIDDRPNGYIYSFCGVNYCFNGNTVNEVDRRVASVLAKTHNVYFRLGINEPHELYGAKGTVYDADGDKARQIYALVSFLCERYGDSIGGIIAGAGFDTPEKYQNLDGVEFEEYIRKYSDYLSILTSALGNNIPQARVIIPVSSDNIPVTNDSDSRALYPMSAMLISLLRTYSYVNASTLTLMVCDDSFLPSEELAQKVSDNNRPSTSPEDNINNYSIDMTEISAGNTAAFERFISSLTNDFDFIESKYFFLWEPMSTVSERDLAAYYAYNYFELCSESNVISFICDFTSDEALGLYTASENLTEIISEMGGSGAKEYADELTKRIADFTFFGVDGYMNYTARVSKLIKLTAADTLPAGRYGTYPIADFSDPSALSMWELGAYSEYISMASVSGGKRALKAHMNLSDYGSEFAEIIYRFDSPKDLTNVSDIAFTLMINEITEADSHEYTVHTVIGGENVRCVSDTNVTVESGKPFVISLNVLMASGLTDVSYVKICVQNSSGKNDDINLSVLSLDAYSYSLSNEDLKELFTPKQADDQNILTEVENGRWKLFAYLVVTVIAVFVISGIIFFGKANAEKEDAEEPADGHKKHGQ